MAWQAEAPAPVVERGLQVGAWLCALKHVCIAFHATGAAPRLHSMPSLQRRLTHSLAALLLAVLVLASQPTGSHAKLSMGQPSSAGTRRLLQTKPGLPAGQGCPAILLEAVYQNYYDLGQSGELEVCGRA